MPGFMAVILIGAGVGFIARFFPGPNTVHGFLLTMVLRVAGTTLATYAERTIGVVESNQLAEPVGMVLGAVIVLFIWNRLVARRIVYDPGMHAKLNK